MVLPRWFPKCGLGVYRKDWKRLGVDMKLTNANTERLKLPPKKTDFIYWDDELPRFGLRLRGGARTWIVQYRTETGQRREKVGTPAALNADAARKKARQILARVQLGHDPVAEKIERKAQAAVTFGAVVARYLALRDPDQPGPPDWKLRARTYLEVRRHLDVQAKTLHRLPLSSVERKTIAARLSEIAAESGPVAADRCRASLSGFFSWTISQGIADVNPVTGSTRHAEAKARQRVLSDEELIDIWNAAGDDDYGKIVRLLMLTGQRRDEVGAIVDSEIDQKAQLWTIAAERSKNHRPHEVPLSDAALAILQEVPRQKGRDLVFGRGAGSFSGWSKAKAALDARILKARIERLGKKATLEPWRLHDIRRTVSTRMNESAADGGLGTLPHIVECVLGHISGFRGGVSGVYNVAAYRAEKRQALDMWEAHLLGLVEGGPSKIVPLKSA
jgi:integrase